MKSLTADHAPADPRLDALFAPSSIAIVGASGNPDNWLSRPLSRLLEHGYEGAVYPVNPRYEEIQGIRTFSSLSAIEQPVDLVVVAVRAPHVIDVIRECAEVDASVAVVFSSGFGEAGEEGRRRQDELRKAAKQAGVRVIGPNCMGSIYNPTSVFATFTSAARGTTRDSGFAFVGQSGALGGSLLGLARESGLGMTAWVSTGNQADCGVVEVARALLERDEVRVVALYLENLDDPAGFIEMNRRAAELEKSVVCMAAGRTSSGWRAAVSHTGALVRPDTSFTRVAERAGAIVVDDLDELHDAAFSLLANTRGAGSKVITISTSGGAGSLIVDHLDRAGLTVDEVPPGLREQLAEYIPDFGSLENPVDVTAALFTGGGHSFGEVCRLIAESGAFDQVIVLATQVADEQAKVFAHQLVELKASLDKPIHLCWLAGRSYTHEGRAILAAAGFPVYDSMRATATAVARVGVSRRRPLQRWPEEIDARFADMPETVTENGAAGLLDVAGVPTPKGILITDAAAATRAVHELGGTAVAKLQSPTALHKTEFGLVRLGVVEAEAEQVAAELLAAGEQTSSEGVLIQEQVPPGLELLVSVTRATAGFPPLLTVGAGGLTTEISADIASAPLPMSEAEVRELLMSLRCAAIMRGYRGKPGFDVESAVNAILAIARAAQLLGPRLRELEVNPLIVQGMSGALAADVLLRLNPVEVQ